MSCEPSKESFSRNLQSISPNLHISLTVGTLPQAPFMVVLSQGGFQYGCTSSEALAYLPEEIKTWCWVGEEGGVYLLGYFPYGRETFLTGEENEQIFGWLLPPPAPP